jgi:serine/threonine-protein kinase RsbW
VSPAPGTAEHVHAPVVMEATAEGPTLTVARQVATGAAVAAGLSGAALHDVKVAVTEACTNVIRHAYPDEAPGTLTLAVWTAGDRLVVSVRDRGVGFCDDGRRASGVGLITIAALASELNVTSHDGHGTEIIMAFAVPAGG